MKKLLIALILILSIRSSFHAQTYALAPYGMVQYFNLAGTTPLAGGKLYTYAAGTTTPLVSYSNSTGTQNANPVVLDSTGRASVYLSSAAYKFVLKTSADVTVWTQDNVQNAGLNAISNFNHTTNNIPKFGGSSTLATSQVTDDGTTVTVGTTTNSISGGTFNVAKDGTMVLGISQATADGFGPSLVSYKSRNTHAAPTNVVDGDILFQFIAKAYSGSSFFSSANIIFAVDGTYTSAQAPPSRIYFVTNAANATGTTQMLIDHTGLVNIARSIIVGSPTGGDKGAGTINTAGDIYKNNTAFTNPDIVFEHYYSGSIVKFKNNPGASTYKGLMSLDETEKFTKSNWQLPGVGSTHGMFERGDILLLHVESLYLHLFEMQHRIDSLESRLSKLEAR